MAMNWGVFRTRALTALVFVGVMSVGLLTSHWLFLLLFSVIHFGCWYEFQQLMGIIYPAYKEISSFHKYGVRMAGWALLLLATANVWAIGTVSLASIGFWLLLVFLLVFPLAEVLFSRRAGIRTLWISAAGLLYISVSISLIIHIRTGAIWLSPLSEEDLAGMLSSISAKIGGFFIPLLMIASIWINDTMAYIVGSFIGKTPLSAISPKKTWEGTIGGILLSSGIITVSGYLYGASWWDFLAISLIAAVAGTFGDLLESKLKRMAGVKDSGHFMPGHGGFLDRFDSLLSAIPFVWLYAYFFTR
jgi:phosphatidate cytidylyltransferase